jgi:phosphotransferase system  glucose/maltose/N-acetylglucosamine-specific IIC component
MDTIPTLTNIEYVEDGYGFAMLGIAGAPLAVFVYATQDEATVAAHLMRSGMLRADGK